MKLLLATVATLVAVIHGQSIQGSSDNDARHYECPSFWLPFRGHCYRYFGDRVPWQEALDTCRQQFSHNGRADLTSIHDVHENSFLYNLFHYSAGDTPTPWSAGQPFYGAWIGLYQTAAGSTGPFIWTDESPFDYSNWRTGQPDNWQGNEDCGHIWRRTTADDIPQPWNDVLCTEHMPFICKMEP